jgi:ABC-2 type transport system ATP-binding protein
MITVQRISKTYGRVQAVSDVSFAIAKGQCVGLLGPNGAGKSTTIKIVTAFLPPSAGSVSIDGFDTIHQSIQARRLIGYLPESTALYPEMRVRDFLVFRAKLYGLDRRQRSAGIQNAMERCWLRDVSARRIGQLSKGYKQRVGLAAAIVHDPPVLVLDEPTNGLDPSQIRESRTLIRQLAQDKTVLVSSHILPEVEQTCDRVLIIARGRLRADGSPAELIARAPGARAVFTEVACVAGDRVRVSGILAGIGGVERVVIDERNSSGEWTRFSMQPAAVAGDLRERIGRVLSEQRLVTRELRAAQPTLEQVFLDIIETDAERAPAIGAAA